MLTGEERMNCTASKTFRDFITAKGLNMSRQRTLVLGAFLSSRQITVDDLFTELRSKHPSLGRSTVYRTLKLLVDCGIARMLAVEEGFAHYERVDISECKTPMRAGHTGSESVTAGEKPRVNLPHPAKI